MILILKRLRRKHDGRNKKKKNEEGKIVIRLKKMRTNFSINYNGNKNKLF